MHFPTSVAASVGTFVLQVTFSIRAVRAAPRLDSSASLKQNIETYVSRQQGNITIPESVYASSNNINVTCGILNAYRNPDLVTPLDGTIYVSEAEQHWSPTAWALPNCIFEPTTIQEVQWAVGLLSITGATYAIRSGGHSPFKGFASTDDGVLIAMHKLTTVEYDAKAETARLGMGNTWGSVYEALIPQQRIVVGGRLAPVGMALITGGGLSHLSNEHGFASDNVVNFEMVLADGTLTNANATYNSDLWFAMKAGQNNFGVTTHITTRTYPMGAVWGGLRQWDSSQLGAVSDAFAEYQRIGQLDPKSSVIADLVPTNGTLFLTLVYFDSVNTTPAAFDAFYKIPAVADTTTLHPTFLDLITVGPAQVVPRYSYGFSNLVLDNSTTYRDVIELCAQQGQKMKSVNGGTQVLIPQPISKSMIDVAKTTGGRPQTLQPRAQLWMNMSWGWNLAKDDDYVYQLIQETYEMVNALTKKRGVYDPYIFLNDAFKNQDPIRSYGLESFQKMQAVSKKYDPTGVFQTQVPGGFKLT